VQDYPEFAEDKSGFIPVPVFSFVVPVEWWRLEIGDWLFPTLSKKFHFGGPACWRQV